MLSSAGPGQFDPFALTGGWLFRGCESTSLASRIRPSKISSTFGGRWFVRNTPVADDSWWLFHVPARHILDTIWLSICLFCLMGVETPPTSTKDDIMIHRYTDILVWYTMSTGILPMILGIWLVDGWCRWAGKPQANLQGRCTKRLSLMEQTCYILYIYI